MKYIIKNNSPIAFEAWKSAENPISWNALGSFMPLENREEGVAYYSKKELREALLEEQNYTCCFCEMTIANNSSTTIAHLDPREGDTQTERIFDYLNLMVSCSGGKKDDKPKNKPRKLHCDASQENRPISISPLSPQCESEITFTIVGKIYGLSTDAKETISILNLNIDKLNNLRNQAIAGYLFLDEDTTEYISLEECKKLIIYLKNTPSEQYRTSVIRAIEQLINISQ